MAKLEFEIKQEIMDDLLEIQKGLPAHATGTTKTGAAPAYDHPAGMALLGMKDDIVDTVVELKMSGGCWDAPNINYADMDKGFRALIAKDRICAGMALIRHPKWHDHETEDNGKMPNHLRYQLHTMRKSFADITKTAWIVLHHQYFRVYRPTKGQTGMVGCREIPIKELFGVTEETTGLVAKKVAWDDARKERKEARRKEREEEERLYRERIERERRAIAEAEEKRMAKLKKKSDEISDSLKEGKQDIIDLGGGMVFMKGKDGKYILWQTKRRTC